MSKVFSIALRGYDRGEVEAAFAEAQDKVNRSHEIVKQAQLAFTSMREQLKKSNDRVAELQRELEEARAAVSAAANANTNVAAAPEATEQFADAELQRMLASAEQQRKEMLDHAERDALAIRTTARAEAETLLNNAKRDAERTLAEATKKSQELVEQANAKVSVMTADAEREAKTLAQGIKDEAEQHRASILSQVNNEAEQIRSDIASQQAEAIIKRNALLAGLEERNETAKKNAVELITSASKIREEADSYAAAKKQEAEKAAEQILREARSKAAAHMASAATMTSSASTASATSATSATSASTSTTPATLGEVSAASPNEVAQLRDRIAAFQQREAVIMQRVGELRSILSKALTSFSDVLGVSADIPADLNELISTSGRHAAYPRTGEHAAVDRDQTETIELVVYDKTKSTPVTNRLHARHVSSSSSQASSPEPAAESSSEEHRIRLVV